MESIIITDGYGDSIELCAGTYPGDTPSVTEVACVRRSDTDVYLDRKAVKKLRRQLKRWLREADGATQ